VSIDPADFLALRSELVHMKARLDESEQARALVEARLGALDASAAAFTSERADISEVATMVLQLQQELSERVKSGGVTGETRVIGPGHDELSAKVDALQNRLFGLQDQGPKIAEFESQIASLRNELAAVTAEAAEPQAPVVATLDPDTLHQLSAMQQRIGEIDHLTQRVGEIDRVHQRIDGLGNVEQRLANVDGLAAQLQQLNARVAGQAELGGQLSALRERVAQLSDQPRGLDDDIRLQLQEIGERLRAGDELRGQIGQLAERMSSNDTEARAVREHMALLDQRLTNVSTELANQISELGRDIDGLGQRVPEIVDGSVSEEVVDALRGGQVKLANEQARYEIAFRQDLAALAEQLRRGNG
jgi:DNA repair exonuclease SbcCD ATPase subunit